MSDPGDRWRSVNGGTNSQKNEKPRHSRSFVIVQWRSSTSNHFLEDLPNFEFLIPILTLCWLVTTLRTKSTAGVP